MRRDHSRLRCAADDVSLDAPEWFHVPGSRVAKRPPSPNSLVASGPPRGKAIVNASRVKLTTNLIKDPDRDLPPRRARLGTGAPAFVAKKDGRKTLMMTDKASKPGVRMKDPRSVEARHKKMLDASNGAAFRRTRGSMANYIEAAVLNRHILPIQQSHQRLSPLEAALPRQIARSKSASVFDFHTLHDHSASKMRAQTAMSRGRGLGGGAGSAAVRAGTAPGQARKEYLARQMDRMALQSRSITRLSPRADKTTASGFSLHDSFGQEQVAARAMTGTRGRARPGQMGNRSPGGDMWAPGAHAGSTLADSWTEGANGALASASPISTGGPGGFGAYGAVGGGTGGASVGGGAAYGAEDGMALTHSYSYAPPQSADERARESSETADEITTFEKKHSLHGPRGMTKKELRLKLRGVQGLGIDLAHASKEELVVAYIQYQESSGKTKTKKQAEQEHTAKSSASRGGGSGRRGGRKGPRFNTGGKGAGPAMRLTPRSAASLASYFNETGGSTR